MCIIEGGGLAVGFRSCVKVRTPSPGATMRAQTTTTIVSLGSRGGYLSSMGRGGGVPAPPPTPSIFFHRTLGGGVCTWVARRASEGSKNATTAAGPSAPSPGTTRRLRVEPRSTSTPMGWLRPLAPKKTMVCFFFGGGAWSVSRPAPLKKK